MSKHWVFTFSVEPPPCTVQARYGGAIFDAWYGKWTRQWIQVLPGGREKVIEEPQMLFLDSEYARTHRLDLTQKHFKTENIFRLRKQKQVQLSLSL